ncbi:T9SS type A sorting domain-containing protein [Lewinella sp. IMCC34191]|uniref:T9SS type A sorting domain-containing protein n=1 Tax=Lewinella sp. IMCC34191 TaxID=2259172 RepID=UPI0018E5389E|nr:T9SS type A sorting domain-containing protein [Lewinella sp. IMCC34191]
MLSNVTRYGRGYPALLLLLFTLTAFWSAPLSAAAPAKGPIVRIENMNKIPGTDRGFPADDYFTFNKIDRNTNSRGIKLKATDTHQMRIHNDGDQTLVITKLTSSYPDDFAVTGVKIPKGGLKIAPGKYVTATVKFVTDRGRGKRVITQELEMKSNAANAKQVKVTFSGIYMTRPEGAWEVDAQQIFDAYGFSTMMGKDGKGEVITRPSSDFPTAARVNAGKEGDLIIADYFEQADPNKPVHMLQLAAFHGPGGARTQLLALGNKVVADMDYDHGGHWHQSVFPRESNTSDKIAGASARRIQDPFKISINNYKTTGGTGNGSLKDKILGVRVYQAIDHRGRIIPNEYILLMDYIGSGCGEGSHNCDWNDNVAYLINARPVSKPTAKDLADQKVNPGKKIDIKVNGAFNQGYPGNELTYAATLVGGGKLPSWMELDKSGKLKVDAPKNAGGNSYRIRVTATDLNRVSASSNFTLTVGNASNSCEVNANADGSEKLLDCDEDDGVKLDGYSSTGKYEWTGPGKFKSNKRNPTVYKEGTYTLTGGKGCGATSTVRVSVDPDCEDEEEPEVNASPLAKARASATSGVAPLRVTFDGNGSSDSDGKIVSYEWRWQGGKASGKSNTLTLGAGRYDVTLTVRDDDGATDTDKVVVNVQPKPVDPPTDGQEITYWLEAECATIGAKWSVGSAGDASNGSFVVVKNGNAYRSAPADRAANQLSFTFQASQKGAYRLFSRVLAPNGQDDSFYFRVNGGAWKTWDRGLRTGKSFAWRSFDDERVSLKSGTNTIDFAFREDGTKLDKLYLTSGKTQPKGMGKAVDNCQPLADDGTDEWLEAECGNVSAGWTIETANGASNGRYLVFKGRRSLQAPRGGETGRTVTYDIDVTTLGEYHLFVRMNAPSYGDNSMFVRVDNGRWVKMWKKLGGGKLETRGFQWRKVNDDEKDVTFRLSPGKHTITLANRESGTKIDKFNLSLSAEPPVSEGATAGNCSSAKARTAANLDNRLLDGPTNTQTVELYPNPATSEVNVTYTDDYEGDVDVMVFDLNGRMVKRSQLVKSPGTLNARLEVSDLPAGMYQIRILTAGRPVVRPFVKQ